MCVEKIPFSAKTADSGATTASRPFLNQIFASLQMHLHNRNAVLSHFPQCLYFPAMPPAIRPSNLLCLQFILQCHAHLHSPLK
jgi:hypothetical protein